MVLSAGHFLVGGIFIEYPSNKHSYRPRNLCEVENHDPLAIEQLAGSPNSGFFGVEIEVKCEQCMVRGAVIRANNLPTSLEGIQEMLKLVNR